MEIGGFSRGIPQGALPSGFRPTECPKERYILQGQRMAWEKAHEIRIMMLLEAAVLVFSGEKNRVNIGNLNASLFCYLSIFKSWMMLSFENYLLL